jgi:acyl-[acyl-carrier-protein]-phospholipid O-acyltransferase / long-chain-fatty-acid--[acyl-carrier-protein] ligase
MKTLLRRPGFGGFLFAQAQVAFNDNATKLILIGLVQWLLSASEASRLVSVISLLLVAPFVLFAPLTGWLADRHARRDVVSASLWLQLVVMIVLCGAAILHSLPLAVGGFFLLGLQSAIMSPARWGMAKELAGENVGEAVGWMEMFGIAAILLGSLAGGFFIDTVAAFVGSPWSAAVLILGVLAAGCVVALLAFRNVPRRPSVAPTAFGWQALFGHGQLLSALRKDHSLWRAGLGDSVFYFVGGILMLTLAQSGRELFPDGAGAARQTGLMLAVLGGGVAAGSVLAARLSRRAVNLGLVPFGALGMSAMFGVLALLAPGSLAFLAALAALGIAGGLYLVPLGAFLVDRSKEGERGRILAASSMLSSIAGVLAVGLHRLTTAVFHLSIAQQFLLLAIIMLAMSFLALRMLPQDVLRVVGLFFARLRYSVRAVGVDHLPENGGALIVCNHVSYVDTIILSLASPRPIRFMSHESFFKTPLLGSILRVFGAIPIAPNRAKDALRRASDCIRAGELVCIYPEGQLTRTGCLMELKSGFEIIARHAQCPVIVAHLDGLWGSIYSFEEGRYFTKLPRGLRRRATVSFAEPLSAGVATAAHVRETLLTLGEAAFRLRANASLARRVLESLSDDPFRTALVDPTGEKKSLRAGELLAISRALAQHWKKSLPEHRIGVILPPGIAGTLANVGLLFAGKVPVNLNPTLSESAARACLEQAGIETILTAAPIEAKCTKFPWTPRVLHIESEIENISRAQKLWHLAAAFLLPTSLLSQAMGLKQTDPDDEAALLFTSGTSGLPKGVALSNRNLITNILQVSETGFVAKGDRLLTALPLFHSFGLTMGLFFPLVARRAIVTAPSPLDCDKLTKAARADAPTVLLATPTFLRHYLKRVPRDAFGTLRRVVSGAEKLPAALRVACRARFGCEVLEGYGLTEASPVASLNLPMPARGVGADTIQHGSREGSAGRLMPGIAMRLLDPETLAEMPGAQRGLLALRGGNLVAGYLGGQAPEKFREGWYITGDIVRIDEDGFLFLEGRSSRFSKIGGEMVSHAAVEQAIALALPSEGAQDCVIGVPCPDKGEELVLLTTRSLSRETLRRALASEAVPNLWMPRIVIQVAQLPALASGKLDLAACLKLAEGAPAAP